MLSRFAVFILAAVVSVPAVTAICNDKGLGISTDIHPEGTDIHQLNVYNTDCSIYKTYNFTSDDEACDSGAFECSPPPFPFSSYTDDSTTYPCHSEPNEGECDGNKIVACCHNES